MAKLICKSARKSQKAVKFHAYHWLMHFYNNRLLAINLSTCAGRPNGKKLASKFELDQSQRKSTQVDGQTKRKLNVSPKLASTCESVWPGFNVLLQDMNQNNNVFELGYNL